MKTSSSESRVPLVESYRIEASALRVARRFIARDFPNERALEKYLKEHPHADESKHHVEEAEKRRPKSEPPPLPTKKKSEPPPLPTKKKSEPPPLPKKKTPEQKKEDAHAKEMHEIEHGGAESVVTKLKTFGAKAMSLFLKAPKAAQLFVTDPKVRKDTITKAQNILKTAPDKLVKNFLETAKHEVHEFKEAGEGIAAVLKGGKMSRSQRHAFKTAAFHVGLTAAATALTAVGPLAASAMFGKSLVKHVALKSVSRALGHFHVLEEFGHIGHGISHVLHRLAVDQSQGKKPNPEEVLVQFVMASVAKEMEDLDLEGIGEALSDADEEEDADEKPKGKSKA